MSTTQTTAVPAGTFGRPVSQTRKSMFTPRTSSRNCRSATPASAMRSSTGRLAVGAMFPSNPE